MNAPTRVRNAADIVAFWREAGPERWFALDPEFDARIAREFGETRNAAARGELDDWIATPESALALIILLDQFPRNMFRGAAAAFSTDSKALAVARKAIALSHDHAYANPLRRFFYLPMMHSEALADQDACLSLCNAAGDADGAKFAQTHRDIIMRFGRFPHRNAILGRATTAEEQAFLDAGGFKG